MPVVTGSVEAMLYELACIIVVVAIYAAMLNNQISEIGICGILSFEPSIP
jgi:hypothetical protein